MLTLEKYSGSASRHTCPACGAKKRFTRYIDTKTGRYLADNVGRCDRESSCGYHLKPGEHFAANSGPEYLQAFSNVRTRRKPGIVWQGQGRKNVSNAIYTQRIATRKPDFIDKRLLIASLRDYDRNAFVQFLLGLFPFDPEAVLAAVSEYKIGTGRNGEAIFWQIDQERRIRTGKLIAYDPKTGKRRKDRSPSWIHSTLKQAGKLLGSFELQQCFFGEHLLHDRPGLPVAIVESEKSAVIASICKGVFPDLVWLATGGKSNLNIERLRILGYLRKIILYPDADGFGRWKDIRDTARRDGLDISISTLIERYANNADKREGCDLADFLIARQRELNDPANRYDLRDLIEERLAIMIFDGRLTEQEAKAAIILPSG